jgi:hypothetical protein
MPLTTVIVSPLGTLSPTLDTPTDIPIPWAGNSPTALGHALPTMPAAAYLPASFFLDLLPAYMEVVYPVQPIMTEAEVRAMIAAMDTDSDQSVASFVYAFGACTLNLTRTGHRRTEEVARTINYLVDKCIDARGPVRPNFESSVPKCMTSLFLHNCLMTNRDKDTAFFYMRDAISLVQLLGIDSMNSEAPLGPVERSRRQRLYWEAFIHERFLALLDYRTAIMPPLATLPEPDPTIPTQIEEGFNQIIKLFKLLDAEFLQNWLSSSNSPTVTPAWVERKDKELAAGEDGTLPDGFELLNPMQRADLIITRHWMRTLIWRMAMSGALLSSGTPKGCLSLLFPLRLSTQLGQEVTGISRDDIEVHGSGILQKLFEIADVIADVILHIPADTLGETRRRIDDFTFWFEFLLTFPLLDQTRKQILLEKNDRIQAMMQGLQSSATSPEMSVASPSTPGDPWYQQTRTMLPLGGMLQPQG